MHVMIIIHANIIIPAQIASIPNIFSIPYNVINIITALQIAQTEVIPVHLIA